MQVGQLARRSRYLFDAQRDPGTFEAELLNHWRQDCAGDGLRASDAHFAYGRIGEKLDVPHALLELVIGGEPALQERATVDRRLDPLRAPIKQTHRKGALERRDDLRNGGLRHAELSGRL